MNARRSIVFVNLEKTYTVQHQEEVAWSGIPEWEDRESYTNPNFYCIAVCAEEWTRYGCIVDPANIEAQPMKCNPKKPQKK